MYFSFFLLILQKIITKMLKFISFGSGSSGNCYYLGTATDAILIDTGVGIRLLKKHAREYGVNLSLVSNILVTHDHADHIKAVGVVSHENHLPVWTTSKVHHGINRNYCVTKKVDAGLVRNIEKERTYQVGEFSVTAFDVPHDSTDCVGYCIEVEGETVCVITDVGTITDTIKGYISRANRLVIEANYDREMLIGGKYPKFLKERIMSGLGHSSNVECAEALVENLTDRIKTVCLCHLSEENNHPELARKSVGTIMRAHGIIPDKDFNLMVLRRKLPTIIFETNDNND